MNRRPFDRAVTDSQRGSQRDSFYSIGEEEEAVFVTVKTKTRAAKKKSDIYILKKSKLQFEF